MLHIEGCAFSSAAIHIIGNGNLFGSKNQFTDIKMGDNVGATAAHSIHIENASMNAFVNTIVGEGGTTYVVQLTRSTGDVTGNTFTGLISNLDSVAVLGATDDPRCWNNYFQGSGRAIDPSFGRLGQTKRQVVLDNHYIETFITRQTAEAFGADGVSDQAAFVAAVAYLVAAGGGELELLPGKSYDIEDDLSVSATVRLVGRGGVLVPANTKTITVLGDIDCGAVQLFDLSSGGAVLLPSGVEARSEWFGDDPTVQTSDATVTSLVEHDIPDESVYLVEIRVIARETDGSGRAVYGKVATVYRTGGGNATASGAGT